MPKTAAEGRVGDVLARALAAFIDRANQLGLSGEQFTTANLRREAAAVYETSPLKSLAGVTDAGLDQEILQAIVLERAAARLPDLADVIRRRDTGSASTLEDLFAGSGSSAYQLALNLNEAVGLTKSIERFDAAYARLFPNRPEARHETWPKLTSAISAAMDIADGNFDRQGIGFQGKARVRRIVFDCLADHIPTLALNLVNRGGTLDPSSVEDIAEREASLACAAPALAESSKSPAQIDAIPTNVVWSEAGWKRDGRPWTAAASY